MYAPNYIVSIVIPCYNEENNIFPLYHLLEQRLSLYPNYEIIYIDDGSTDSTPDRIRELATKNKFIRFIRFSRNFGHQHALKAGLDYATGDCVISMDGDMQHPSDLISEFIEKWIEGYQVVYTARKPSSNIFSLKEICSSLFYRLVNLISTTHLDAGTADFRLLDRTVVNVLKRMKESPPFIRGLVSWVGFNQYCIQYEALSRNDGTSKYTFRKMITLATNGIAAFSISPLRVSLYLGLFCAFLSFVYGTYAIYMSIFTKHTVPGWTSIIICILFFSGIQLTMLGIIGEYLGKMFIENKQRPVYIIAESLGIHDTEMKSHPEKTVVY